jgi:two-component system NarL family sensor kinase
MTSFGSGIALADHQLAPVLEGRLFGALDEIQEVIDGLVEQVALIGCDGKIVAINESWRRQVERQARTGLHISRDYVRFLEGLIEGGDDGVRPILQAFRDINAGSRRTFRCVYKGTGTFAGIYFNLVISALTVHDTRYVLVSVHDVTELVGLKRQRRRMGTQLLRAQEVERRRIARELHDSTSQMLVALQFDLARLSGETGSSSKTLISACKKAVREIQQEIRAFSFLAHPPSLGADDLRVALENLARGFAARSDLEIDVTVSDEGEAADSIRAAIYRLAQEALSNIHRHAHAKRAIIRLVGRKHYLHLLIQDDGVGFDPRRATELQSLGVGVTGMRERVRELGGRLKLQRAEQGTALTVTLPRDKRMLFAPAIGGL